MNGARSACNLSAGLNSLGNSAENPQIGHFLHQWNSGWGSNIATWHEEHDFIHLLYLGVSHDHD